MGVEGGVGTRTKASFRLRLVTSQGPPYPSLSRSPFLLVSYERYDYFSRVKFAQADNSGHRRRRVKRTRPHTAPDCRGPRCASKRGSVRAPAVKTEIVCIHQFRR